MQDRQMAAPAEGQVRRRPACRGGRKTRLVLNRDGYDSFIDFLKGVCILLVVLTHCLPDKLRAYTLFPLWGGPAVPLFLIIQVFHTYKKGLGNVAVNYAELWRRIIKPFVLTEAVILLISFAGVMTVGSRDMMQFFRSAITGGGRGPGSYYPWVYVQFAILLPLVAPMLRRMKGVWIAGAFVLISELIEILCSWTAIPQWLYRLAFLRYTFLIYLGYVLAHKGYVLNGPTALLSIFSIAATLFFAYSSISLSPFIFDTGWKICHWMCYIYIAYLMLFLLRQIYRKIPGKLNALRKYIQRMGKYSYEIFLFQMFYFTIVHRVILKVLSWIGNNYLAHSAGILLAVMICVIPVVRYKDWRQVHSS